MIAVGAVEFKNNFKALCDRVNKGEVVIIPRPHNKNVVVLSEAEYNGLERSRRNAEYVRKLEQGRADIEAGKGIVMSMDALQALADE
jgi:antitoxin YefM